MPREPQPFDPSARTIGTAGAYASIIAIATSA
jgi:hypothetical protein